MESNQEKISTLLATRGRVTTAEISKELGVSRQYIHQVLIDLINQHKVIKIGSTKNSFYITVSYAVLHPEIIPQTFKKTYRNTSLEEHRVLTEIEERFPQLRTLPENVSSIFTFAFSEMFNNAIEHSGSKIISVEVTLRDGTLTFIVSDSGQGVFRNIMKMKKLNSEFEAIQDLLKGKTTTMPKSHSGEGIFFTSKAADTFKLESFNYLLDIDTLREGIEILRPQHTKRGTRVIFSVNANSERHLTDVFRKYTNQVDDSDFGFDRTEIRIKLFSAGGVCISRSQARRVIAGLEKFKIILFDYDQVPMVGQAFADEIYRVFQERHPNIRIENENMNDGVQFMIQRAKNEAKMER